MDWGTLLLAVGLVYLAYEAGRWSQREDIKKQAEIHVMIMKAFEKAQQENHYQSIVDKNEDIEKNKFVEGKIKENFDLSPRGIREMLNLNKPIYEKTAAYGHFGRNPEDNGSFSWEKTDKIGIFSE